MKVKDDKCLYGLRFIDNNGNNVLDLSTQSEGTWVERVIPEGKELYGIRCSTLSLDGKPNDAIHQLGFTLRDSKEQPKPQTEQPAPVVEPAIQKPSKYERMTPKEKFITIAKEVTDKYGQFEEKAPQRSGVRIKKALVVLDNGEMYQGEWNDEDEYDGFGARIDEDGDFCEGYWINGEQNGPGRWLAENGEFYSGTFKDDLMHGQGTYITKDGDKYVGQFVDGNQEGQGIKTWPDGRMYEGTWKDDQMNGTGIFWWPDGKKYEGQFKADEFQGQGIKTWPNGKRYEGQFAEDEFEGEGVFSWPDGRRYEGAWLKGKMHGAGKYTTEKGKVRKGQWFNGQLVEVEPEANKTESPMQ